MKTNSLILFAIDVAAMTGMTAALAAQPPKLTMTTEIPASIKIPEKVESRLGTLRFEDGFPTEETAQKIVTTSSTSSVPWRA